MASDLKLQDWISLGAFLVSGLSAYAAIQAKNTAQELSEREFRTERTLEILASVHTEMTKAGNDPERLARSCFFVATLGNAELHLRKNEPPHFVRNYVEDVSRAGLWPPTCDSKLESLISDSAPAATDVEASSGSPDTPSKIGQWHALIASYNVTEKGCNEARNDVKYFAPRLSGQGFKGKLVYVVRTKISNNYAVTVDAGDDRSTASAISDVIRSVGPPDGTGRDSFVQGNRSWFIDQNCIEFARIAD